MKIESIFGDAAAVDSSLKITKAEIARLEKLRVTPKKFRRETLFGNIARGKVSLFYDYPAPVRKPYAKHSVLVSEILESIERSKPDGKIRTSVGHNRRIRYLSPKELVAKWRKNSTPINVTDFHIRNIAVEQVIHTGALSQFNFLPGMSDNTNWLEMMTMVISSEGGFSDSHSDDCDGSNHCFIGKKLWLAWDTEEGLAAGLQDLDQQRITGRCAFNVDTFLSLSSACWFVVSEGQTLFMPGHLTHKVITLEPYLGVGSFYIGFPNVLRTLSRWQRRSPNWERLENKSLGESMVSEIIQSAQKQAGRISRTSMANQLRWGLDYSYRSAKVLRAQNKALYPDQSDTGTASAYQGVPDLERRYLALSDRVS